MNKNYRKMTQKELEMELVDIVKRNYEKGILLLDHNFDIKRLRTITKMEDVEDIDDLICIMRSMKYMPDMAKYFLKDTDKMEFKLIEIIGDKVYELLSFTNFSSIDDAIMLMYLTDRLKDKHTSYGSYPVVQMLNGKFIGTLAVMLYNDEPYLDCAEDNDCAECEKVYNTKDIYREAAKRLLESKYGIKAS
ncbi:MAG: hypothetical protein HDQ99_05760 [Lachnospiraceae bacterium]|nr:hypothetical protein [Lachnospiraceae bacterium]